MLTKEQVKILHDFHNLCEEKRVFYRAHWMGVDVLKNPFDMWAYQEVIYETRPDVIVECGTYFGGSALYFAHLCDCLGLETKIVSIDIRKVAHAPSHPRIEWIRGSSVDIDIFHRVEKMIKPGDDVMVILDSCHVKEHVYKELLCYAPLVTVGNYIVIEDTCINGNPILPGWGEGPMEAVRDFLEKHGDQFSIDKEREQFLLTSAPDGWLRRLK